MIKRLHHTNCTTAPPPPIFLIWWDSTDKSTHTYTLYKREIPHLKENNYVIKQINKKLSRESCAEERWRIG